MTSIFSIEHLYPDFHWAAYWILTESGGPRTLGIFNNIYKTIIEDYWSELLSYVYDFIILQTERKNKNKKDFKNYYIGSSKSINTDKNR